MKPIKVQPRRLLIAMALYALTLAGVAAPSAPSAPSVPLAAEGTASAASQASAMRSPHAPATPKKKAAPVPVKLVDINSASRDELKTLPGIGDAEAARIVAGRPYLSKADLVTRNVLPTGPYLSLKNQIIAMQSTPPKAQH